MAPPRSARGGKHIQYFHWWHRSKDTRLVEKCGVSHRKGVFYESMINATGVPFPFSPTSLLWFLLCDRVKTLRKQPTVALWRRRVTLLLTHSHVHTFGRDSNHTHTCTESDCIILCTRSPELVFFTSYRIDFPPLSVCTLISPPSAHKNLLVFYVQSAFMYKQRRLYINCCFDMDRQLH